jgi:4'-phosphopantetheinyl transferase
MSNHEKKAGSDINAVDIWLTNIADINDSMRKLYMELLNQSELERYKRFIVKGAASQFLVARALLRTTLSRYADVAYRDWNFEVNSYGKPYILLPQDCIDLHFNISHTEGLVACAVSRKYVVGIDIENSLRDLDNLISDPGIFAVSEMRAMRQLSEFERKQHFFSLWTLKEAYIKARGIGLSIPLDAFWFDFDDDRARISF